ncbi:MAG TPA: hypothetical protein VI792_10725, partial [Candidatus Eisenbacteria bacterium]
MVHEQVAAGQAQRLDPGEAAPGQRPADPAPAMGGRHREVVEVGAAPVVRAQHRAHEHPALARDEAQPGAALEA